MQRATDSLIAIASIPCLQLLVDRRWDESSDDVSSYHCYHTSEYQAAANSPSYSQSDSIPLVVRLIAS